VVELALFVLANLEDQGEKRVADPTDCPELLGKIQALIQIVRPGEYLLSLFEADPTLRIFPQLAAFSRIEVESHLV
jgi:hypothetical protein